MTKMETKLEKNGYTALYHSTITMFKGKDGKYFYKLYLMFYDKELFENADSILHEDIEFSFTKFPKVSVNNAKMSIKLESSKHVFIDYYLAHRSAQDDIAWLVTPKVMAETYLQNLKSHAFASSLNDKTEHSFA